MVRGACRRLVLLLTLWGGASCDGRPPFVVLTVEDPENLASDFKTLAIGPRLDALGSVNPDRHSFPLAITVTRARRGVSTLWTEARADDGTLLARGVVEARFKRKGSPAATVVLRRACAVDADCVDGLFCTGPETCGDGVCVAGSAPCQTSFPCIASTCVEGEGGTGTCVSAVNHALCATGTYCNPTAGCVPGRGCHTDTDCDDGLFCNGSEHCVGLICEAGVPPDVGDTDPCTVDGCNEDEGIIHVADASFDGNLCTLAGGGREVCVNRLGGCVLSYCGDGFVDAGAAPAELCDDGETNADGWTQAPHCNSTCTALAPHCGDGEIDPGEACDDGNTVDDGNDCGADCQCAGIACVTPQWTALGDSDFGLWTQRIAWGSLAPAGIWTPRDGRIKGLSAAMANDGRLYVVASAEIDWQWQNLFAFRYDGTSWEAIFDSPLLGINDSTSYRDDPALAIDGTGMPVVAWADWHSIYEYVIYVLRYNGSDWVEMGSGSASGGGIAASSNWVETPAIAVTSAGTVVVTWAHSPTTNTHIYGKRFNGTSWQVIGAGSASGSGISATAGSAKYPSLVAGAGGVLYLAWVDRSSGRQQIYVKQWTGSVWTEVGAGSASAGGVSNSAAQAYEPHVQVDGVGSPVVAWVDTSMGAGLEHVYTKKWDGAAWVEIGTGSASGTGLNPGTDDAREPVVGVTSTGDPFVVWIKTMSAYGDLLATQWDGAAWTEMGEGSGVPPGLVADLDPVELYSIVRSPVGDPIVVLADDVYPEAFFAMRWSGTAWEELPGTASGQGVSASLGDATTPAIAMGDDGVPAVFWVDNQNGNEEIYGRRWSGTAWEELGTGSATGGGLSNTLERSYSPVVAQDVAGGIVLAWVETTVTPGPHVFLKRWDGVAWQELGGSASGSGLSEASGSGRYPALALTSAGEPVVAWVSVASDVFVRRWSGSAWESYDGTAAGGPVGHGSFVALALTPQDRPILAWDAGNICAKIWDGASWGELSPGSATGDCLAQASTNPETPRIAIDAEGRVVLVVADWFLGSQEIHVQRWNGVTWSYLDEPQFPYGNASRSLQYSFAPSMVLDSYGRPMVAWVDDTNVELQPNIFVRRWNDSQWLEVGESSARDYGISNSHCASESPALGLGGDRACVVWSECGSSGSQILVRCVEW